MQVHHVSLVSSGVQMACALIQLGYAMDKMTAGIGLMSLIAVSRLGVTIHFQVCYNNQSIMQKEYVL